MGFWKNVGLFLLLLCIVDLSVALFLRIRFADLLFMEGILVFAVGAYVASGMSNPRRENWKTLSTDSEGYREFLEDQRPKQLSDGVILMIIGAIMIGLSLAIGLTLTGFLR